MDAVDSSAIREILSKISDNLITDLDDLETIRKYLVKAKAPQILSSPEKTR